MSSYDEYLRQLKDQHSATAKSATKVLYELLKKEDPHLSREDMYDRILKDCLAIWARHTIVQNMPDELKDEQRQDAGRKGAEAKKEMIVTNDGNIATESVAKNSSVEPKQQESPTFHSADETLNDDEEDERIPARPQFDDFIQRNNELERENKELKEAIEQMNLFNKASEIPKAEETENKTDELFLSMDHWSTMFMIMRNGEKRGFWCKHNGKEITQIEANYVRAKAEALKVKPK